MYSNIIFIGGIHGVGKSTVCKAVSEEFGYVHLSASEVIKWKEINEDEKNKKVKDIPYTQDRLIQGLSGIIKTNSIYLLDGHFCLFNSSSEIRKVPFETFEKINPILVAVVIADPQEIAIRLSERDGKTYVHATLAEMQSQEIDYGKMVAEKLSIPYVEVSFANYEPLISQLKKIEPDARTT